MLRRPLAASFALAACAQADMIRVPEDHPTIQGAIDAASDGDEVVVSPGTYLEHEIRYGGKKITVRGTDPLDMNVVRATVVDAEEAAMVFGFLEEDSCAVLSGLTITRGYEYADAGGITCSWASPRITHCVVRDNRTGEFGFGGGIQCGLGGSPLIEDCVIENNYAFRGSGIACLAPATPTIRRCLVRNNGNSGVYITASDVAVQACRIEGNRGGVSIAEGNATLTNLEITGNDAGAMSGGGIRCSDAIVVITNATIARNEGRLSDELYLYGGRFYMKNCIVWNDEGTAVYLDGGGFEPTYSDISGGWPGEGNIDADPLFVDPGGGDHHLQADSPCIDKGTPEGAPGTDIDGDPRPIGDGYDMGADEYNPVDVKDTVSPAAPAVTMLGQAHPNPFNPHTTIPFELAQPSSISLAIYDITGALVRVLEDDTRQAGSHAVSWDGANEAGQAVATGVYVVRLEAGAVRETQKLVLVK